MRSVAALAEALTAAVTAVGVPRPRSRSGSMLAGLTFSSVTSGRPTAGPALPSASTSTTVLLPEAASVTTPLAQAVAGVAPMLASSAARSRRSSPGVKSVMVSAASRIEV